MNLQREAVLTERDRFQAKLAFFDNKVDNYITRFDGSYYFANIPSVKFRGLELSMRYDARIFYAELSGTKYLKTEFCDYSGRDYSGSGPRETLVCRENGSQGGYGQMHLPPEFSTSITLGTRLFEEKLELGTRVTYVGERPSTTFSGAYTATIDWEAYTLFDLFSSYKLNEDWELDFAVDNITDQYYMDALNLGLMPSPGRTLRLGMSGKF